MLRPLIFVTFVLYCQFSAASTQHHDCIDTKQAIETCFANPVIPGFFPDPSVVRVDEDYYLVNSSFEWFPSVPIFHSKDLVNWELISHAVSEPDFLPSLNKVERSKGIYAPTIHYQNGTFYIITTCVQCGQNFYVTAKTPQGPWSEPIWVEGDRGIDPSLFWDKDGKSYYLGTGILERKQVTWPDPNGIWIQEIELSTGKLLGNKTQLTYGHAANAKWTEGPHLYKRGKWYYLMVAEGGTGENHAVTIFRSENILGPYIAHQKNPVLTHRNLGANEAINSSGHADMVQTQHGDWYALMLAKRGLDGTSPLARETFLTSVVWEDEWPVFSPGYAKLLLKDKRPNLRWTPKPGFPARDEFDNAQLHKMYLTLRAQKRDWLNIKNGQLHLTLKPQALNKESQFPSMLVRRIQHAEYELSTLLNFSAKNKHDEAGLVIYRDYKNFYTLAKQDGQLQVRMSRQNKEEVLATTLYAHDSVFLQIVDEGEELAFYFGQSENTASLLLKGVNADATSDALAGGFNGPMLGVYGVGGDSKTSQAAFEFLEYKTK